jgi:hypothetical protein
VTRETTEPRERGLLERPSLLVRCALCCRFGFTTGLTVATCSGTCSAGYYCPAGSTNATAYPCPPGTFLGTTGGTAQSSCSACPVGYFCPVASVSGTANPCPAGTYRDTTGGTATTSCSACLAGRYGATPAVSVATCSGTCSAGYYCPTGSTSATAYPCPVGYFCPVGTGSSLQNPCAAGQYQNNPGQSICKPCTVEGSFSLAGASSCSQ